jgi:hypothetical protein
MSTLLHIIKHNNILMSTKAINTEIERLTNNIKYLEMRLDESNLKREYSRQLQNTKYKLKVYERMKSSRLYNKYSKDSNYLGYL